MYGGLPHSEITGSIRMCHSPVLIAAYHVLLRLWEPRHPPFALICFFMTYSHCLVFVTLLILSLSNMSMYAFSFPLIERVT